MKKGVLALLAGLIVVTISSAFPTNVSASPVLREDDAVVIDGVTEHWKLVWQSEPSLICVPEGDDAQDWYTCPCMGYAFGERGALDLVRSKPGKSDEVFHLTPLFSDSESPADGQATLQRWPVLDSDNQWYDTAPDDVMDQIRKRDPVKVIQFADYNHDGQATEFLLQVNVAPCGKREMALIGVTKANPVLHLFSTAEHPDKPLMLYEYIWNELLESEGDVTRVEWSCGDHGSEEQQEMHLHTDTAGIHATELTYACDKNSEKGTLKSREVL